MPPPAPTARGRRTRSGATRPARRTARSGSAKRTIGNSRPGLVDPRPALCMTKRTTRPPQAFKSQSQNRLSKRLLDALLITTCGAEEIRTPDLFRARDQDGLLGACLLPAKTAPDLLQCCNGEAR